MIQRFRKSWLGLSTEKIGAVIEFEGEITVTQTGPTVDGDASKAGPARKDGPQEPKHKGHVRSGAAYRGVEKIQINHESLYSGDRCGTAVWVTGGWGSGPAGASNWKDRRFRLG